MTTTSETFERLYADYHIGIGKHVGAMMRRYPEDVDDIVQDTWCKVWRALPAEEQEPSYRWVQRIATNTALDVLRTRALHQRLAPTVSLDDAPAGAVGAHPGTARAWEEVLVGDPCVSERVIARERLEAVLARLKPSSRHLLLLNCVGFSSREIAERHPAGYSVQLFNIVKNQVQFARQDARAARDYEEARSG